jgi:hypothetical protein
VLQVAPVEPHQLTDQLLHYSVPQVVWAVVVVKVILILVVRVVQVELALQPAELQDLVVLRLIQALDYQLVVLAQVLL